MTHPTDDSLKPCPFCGGAASLHPRTCDKNTPYNPADRAFPIARCGQCGAEAVGKDWGRPETAAEKWNARALLAEQARTEPVAWVYWHPSDTTYDGPDTLHKKAVSRFTDDTRKAMMAKGWLFEPLYPASTAAQPLKAEQADLIDYLKGVYAFIESTSPAGFAEEAFRLPPSATRNQRSLFDAITGDTSGELSPAAGQDMEVGGPAGRIAGVEAEQAKDAAEDARMTTAARDVLAERQRQVSAEGWTPEHDDEHRSGDMARAAASYAAQAGICGSWPAGAYMASLPPLDDEERGEMMWPWNREWWKPKNPRADLVRAGALILAEIERMDRAARAAERKA